MEYTKKIGTREEVYILIAKRTNGGLFKSDIIEKNNNGKFIYISKKISEKMKANTSNICFLKKTHNNNQYNKKSNQINKKNKNCKTQKLSFQITNNKFKNIYYPELKGQNLEDLKEELRREEEEEDKCETIEGLESLDELEEVFKPNSSKPNTEFKIEELKDIDIDININDF